MTKKQKPDLVPCNRSASGNRHKITRCRYNHEMQWNSLPCIVCQALRSTPG